MNNLISNYIKIITSVFLLFTFLLTTACKSEEAMTLQQIIIKLEQSVEVSGREISTQSAKGSIAELERINAISKSNNALITAVFSEGSGRLNQNGEFNHYIAMTFVNEIDEVSISNIIEELESLESVETAYQAPIGEDAGMSLPEN